MASDSDRRTTPRRGEPPAPDEPGPRATGRLGEIDDAATQGHHGDPEVVGFVTAGPDGVPVPIHATADRPRGLDAYFAPGGDDGASPERRADERRMLRLLVLMIALLVVVPTVLTLIAFAGQILSLRSGG